MRIPRSSRRAAHAISLTVLLLVSAGCGYSLVSGRPARPTGSVAIVTPENRTAEPGIELVVADALRREFLRRGQLEVVRNPDGADFVVSGRVKRVETRTRTFSEVVVSLEFSVSLLLDLQLERADGVLVALDPRALEETEVYLASADVEATRTNRGEALRRLAGLLAGRVHDAISIARGEAAEAGGE